jgi:hypothetical protein
MVACVIDGVASQCIYQRCVVYTGEWTLIELRGTDNILFSLPYIEERYRKTLEVNVFPGLWCSCLYDQGMRLGE